jgi:agmatinase
MSNMSWFGLATDAEDTGPVDLAVFGIPYDAAVFFRRGAAGGPARIRALSPKIPPSSETGKRLDGCRIADLGDVDPGEDADEVRNPVGLHRRAKEIFLRARSRGLPLALGGDHSVSIPLLAAAAEEADSPLGLIWIDAHPDLCDAYQGSRFSHACVMRRALDHPNVRPENISMVGVRSYEIEELDFMESHAMKPYTAHMLARSTADDVAGQIVDRYRDLPVYLSIDIDAFDPAYAPGTGIPDAAGLNPRFVIDLLHGLSEVNVIAVDLVEVAPRLDGRSHQTSLLALKLILEILHMRKQGE